MRRGIDADGFTFALSGIASGPGQGGLPSGTRLCPHLDVHHDGAAEAVSCLARRDGTIVIGCAAFGGSYLSLAAALPEFLASRLGPGKVLAVRLEADASRPLAAFLRLNIGSADGDEVFHEAMVVSRGTRSAAFDLDAVRLPFDGRLHGWVDVIFSRPEGIEITVSEIWLRLVGKDEL